MFYQTKLAAALALSLISSPLLALDYTIDPTHTSVVASWSHFGFSHPKATLSNITGTIAYDAQAPEKTSVNVTVPVSSIYTMVPDLDKEFNNDSEYFDTKKFPIATFVSSKVVKKDDKHFNVMGTLTIKGISKPVTLNATLNKQGEHPMAKLPTIGLDASTVIKRSDFKIDKYVPYVSDEVTLTITVEALAKK